MLFSALSGRGHLPYCKSNNQSSSVCTSLTDSWLTLTQLVLNNCWAGLCSAESVKDSTFIALNRKNSHSFPQHLSPLLSPWQPGKPLCTEGQMCQFYSVQTQLSQQRLFFGMTWKSTKRVIKTNSFTSAQQKVQSTLASWLADWPTVPVCQQVEPLPV